MTTVRKEYSAPDAQPVVLYVKSDPDSQLAYPLLSELFGAAVTLTSPTYIGDDSKDVTLAGTREQLSTSITIKIKYVIITAKEANTGTIWIGGNSVAAGRGRPLVALQSERLDIDYLSKIYIDSTVDGEGVTFTYTSNEASSSSIYLTDDDGNLITDDDGNPILVEDTGTTGVYLLDDDGNLLRDDDGNPILK